MRILLVGQRNLNADSHYTLLEREGYDVLTAQNGHEGRVICRRSIHPISLLITEYAMPRISGVQLACECALRYSGLRVLYTLDSPPNDELQAELRRQRRGFLTRPFRGDDLLHKARILIGSPAASCLALAS